MMDWRTLPIAMAYVVLAALVCWFVVSLKGNWLAKALLVGLALSTVFVVWRAMPSYQGWPTKSTPPDRSVMLWAVAREPSPDGTDPGEIDLWLVPFEGDPSKVPLSYDSYPGEPRAYRLPYSQEAHKGVEAARELIRQGRPVIFERQKPGEEGGDATMDGQGQYGRSGQPMDGFRMYELPPPPPPVKDY